MTMVVAVVNLLMSTKIFSKLSKHWHPLEYYIHIFKVLNMNKS